MVKRKATPPPKPRQRSSTLILVALFIAGTGFALLVANRHPIVPPVTTTSTTTSTTITTSTTTSTTLPRLITLAAVGDTDLGDTPLLPASPSSEFQPVTALLHADITFANLEGTMTDSGANNKCGPTSTECFSFRVPPSYASIYRQAGFNILNSANNHSYDFGAQGVAQTSAALQRAGIAQAGLPGQIGYVSVKGVRVAFVDFAPYYLTNNLLVSSQLPILISQAKHHAAIVVVYMHAGAEGTSADHVTRQSEFYFGENRGNAYAFAHAAIDDGADLVIGSGPHVWRGMQWYRGRLIVYSMGDFTNYDAFSSSGTLAISGVLHVTLNSTGSFVTGSLDPVLIAPGGRAVPDATHQLWGFVNALSRADFGSSAALVSPTGQIER